MSSVMEVAVERDVVVDIVLLSDPCRLVVRLLPALVGGSGFVMKAIADLKKMSACSYVFSIRVCDQDPEGGRAPHSEGVGIWILAKFFGMSVFIFLLM